MKTALKYLYVVAMTIYLFIGGNLFAQTGSGECNLKQNFDFSKERTRIVQHYKPVSKLKEYSAQGFITGTKIFSSHIKCEPIGEKEFKYTCMQFVVTNDSVAMEIPDLKGWNYIFYDGIDENGFVFGIDHAKFDNLTFIDGSPVPPEIAYHVYNSFIDFHAMDAFAERTEEGNGIQNLAEIGQTIVHASAFSQPPTSLGDNVAEGSYFKNGEVTLELKGLSCVNDKTCAIIQYDSGESSFKMIMNPAPNMEITTEGRSHYYGDIYKDLKTGWVQKVTLMENVISQTQMPQPYGNVNSVIEREILIMNVGVN